MKPQPEEVVIHTRIDIRSQKPRPVSQTPRQQPTGKRSTQPTWKTPNGPCRDKEGGK